MIRRCLVCCLLVALTTPLGSRADEDGDEAPAAVAANARQIQLSERSFDQWVFGGGQQQIVQLGNERQVVNVTPPSSSEFRKRMEAFVAAEIRSIDLKLSLTEAQKKKLQLAARGDIAEHINRAEELRPKLTAKPLDPPQYLELMRQLLPLRMVQQTGLFNEQSMFWKTLRSTVTDDQRAGFRTLERERRKDIIEKALLDWETQPKRFVLMGETRRRFIDVILDHGHVPFGVGPYGKFVVLLEANLLRNELKPLLSESEWERLEYHVPDAQQFEPTLEASGIWSAHQRQQDDNELADETKDQ